MPAPRPPRTVLSEVADVIECYLKRCNLVERSKEMALDICLAIGNHFGGRPFYLPKAETYKKALRDAEIHSAFNGSNHYELASQYGLTVSTIYRILGKQEDERRAARNGNVSPSPQP